MADEAAGDAAPRRSSRRELPPRATSPALPASFDDDSAPAALRVDSGGDEASEPSATAPTTPDQQSTRRSRRQVKSTYATHALASPSPVAAIAEESERATKRRRPNPSAAPASPVSEAPQVLLVKVDPSFPRQAIPTEPVETASSAPVLPASPTPSVTASPAPNSANRRRRPVTSNGNDTSSSAGSIWSLTSALETVTPMGDADVSMRTQQRKVLGKYTGRECTLLCEVILQQLKRNSMDAKALERDHSPAFIQWEKVAHKLLKTHRLTISPLDAQTLWKFLAYAEQPPMEICSKDGASVEELLPASDSEDYAQSVQTINEKFQLSKKLKPSGSLQIAAETLARSRCVGVESGVKDESPVTEAPTQTTDPVLPGAHFRLYPVYGLPTGLPESWQQTKPFNLKETLPLTFVAEKFLRKKAVAAPPGPSLVAATSSVSGFAVASVVPAATPTASTADSAAQAKPKPKRVRKAELKVGATEKPRASSQKSPAPRKAVASPAPPRAPFVPSSTPPPQPLPPRAAFQFFCRMQEAESLAETFVAVASGAAEAVKKKTYFELQDLFARASLQVRNACQKLALEDLDRYNRECVRRRIWEKAMSNSPVASPAPGSAPTPAQQHNVIPSMTLPVAIPATTDGSNSAAQSATPGSAK